MLVTSYTLSPSSYTLPRTFFNRWWLFWGVCFLCVLSRVEGMQQQMQLQKPVNSEAVEEDLNLKAALDVVNGPSGPFAQVQDPLQDLENINGQDFPVHDEQVKDPQKNEYEQVSNEVPKEEESTSLVDTLMDNFREKWDSFQNLSLVEKGIAATTAAAIGAVGLYAGYRFFSAPNILAAAPEVLVNLPSSVSEASSSVSQAFSEMQLKELGVFDFTGEQEMGRLMGGLWDFLEHSYSSIAASSAKVVSLATENVAPAAASAVEAVTTVAEPVATATTTVSVLKNMWMGGSVLGLTTAAVSVSLVGYAVYNFLRSAKDRVPKIAGGVATTYAVLARSYWLKRAAGGLAGAGVSDVERALNNKFAQVGIPVATAAVADAMANMNVLPLLRRADVLFPRVFTPIAKYGGFHHRLVQNRVKVRANKHPHRGRNVRPHGDSNEHDVDDGNKGDDVDGDRDSADGNEDDDRNGADGDRDDGNKGDDRDGADGDGDGADRNGDDILTLKECLAMLLKPTLTWFVDLLARKGVVSKNFFQEFPRGDIFNGIVWGLGCVWVKVPVSEWQEDAAKKLSELMVLCGIYLVCNVLVTALFTYVHKLVTTAYAKTRLLQQKRGRSELNSAQQQGQKPTSPAYRSDNSFKSWIGDTLIFVGKTIQRWFPKPLPKKTLRQKGEEKVERTMNSIRGFLGRRVENNAQSKEDE